MKAQGLVGVGLDAQHADRYPGGLVGLCTSLRGRLSHLSIVSISDEAHARWFRAECAGDLPIIHHLSGVAPAASTGPDIERFAQLDRISQALDARWSCEDIGLWSFGPYALPYFTPPILNEETASHVAAGIRLLSTAGSVPFLAEIPSFTLTAGEVPLGEFFHRIVEVAGCGIVADVSHVFSYAINVGCSPASVLRSLPLDHVREVHVAGGHVDEREPRRYMDTHSEPVLDEILDLLGEAIDLCPNLCAVTFEIGVGLGREAIEDGLLELERIVDARRWRPRVASWPRPMRAARA